MEIAAAFIGGVVAGGCGSLAFSMNAKPEQQQTPPLVKLIPPPLPPPLPPPSPLQQNTGKRIFKPKKLLKLRCDLHLETIVDPITGEDMRDPIERPQPILQESEVLRNSESRVEIKLTEVLNITTRLRKAPKPMSIEEKREAFFAKSPLFQELLSKKKTVL